MKLITAVIKPGCLDDVVLALSVAGIDGMTVTEGRGFGRESGSTQVYRGAEFVVRFLPRLRLEILVPEELAEIAVDAVAKAAGANRDPSGKVWVTDVTEAVRLSTGEIGEAAI